MLLEAPIAANERLLEGAMSPVGPNAKCTISASWLGIGGKTDIAYNPRAALLR